MFTRESLLASGWYRERLQTKQSHAIALWQRQDAALPDALNLGDRLSAARTQLARVSASAYLAELVGTIGADPFQAQMP
jgi:hypothetical protein